ncbi:hypothetical protein MHU86_1113 [Fragilaria crotonensis]|nr:hypothetical protein MHU86_1113 [Fragilaria crotonensis]
MQRIQHVTPAKAEHSPHPWQLPTINLDATIRSTASDKLLAVESDASYLSVVEARSRALPGYVYLTSKPAKPTDDTLSPMAPSTCCAASWVRGFPAQPRPNLGLCSLRIVLEEMGHPQSATPMATDYSQYY